MTAPVREIDGRWGQGSIRYPLGVDKQISKNRDNHLSLVGDSDTKVNTYTRERLQSQTLEGTPIPSVDNLVNQWAHVEQEHTCKHLLILCHSDTHVSEHDAATFRKIAATDAPP